MPLNQVGILNKIKKASAKLEQESERIPSTDEIAKFIEIPKHKIEESIKALFRYTSTDAKLIENDDDTFLDILPDEESISPERELLQESLRIEIRRSLSTLSQKEQDIVNLYYGLSGEKALTLEEIGEKIDLTRERVRKIKEKAIRRLKHQARSKNLRAYLG